MARSTVVTSRARPKNEELISLSSSAVTATSRSTSRATWATDVSGRPVSAVSSA